MEYLLIIDILNNHSSNQYFEPFLSQSDTLNLTLNYIIFYLIFRILNNTQSALALHEKCPKTEFFLVRIFLYSVLIQENTDQKKLRLWTLFTQCWLSAQREMENGQWNKEWRMGLGNWSEILFCLEKSF